MVDCHRNFERHRSSTTKDVNFHNFIRAVKVERSHEFRKIGNRPIVDANHDIADLQASRAGSAVRIDIGNDCSPAPRKAKTCGHCRGDVLNFCADRDPQHASELPKVLVVEIDDLGWNCKSQSLVATALAQYQSINSNHVAIDVHQWAATVSRVEGRISLDVDHGTIRVGLPGDRADHSHSYRIA